MNFNDGYNVAVRTEKSLPLCIWLRVPLKGHDFILYVPKSGLKEKTIGVLNLIL